MKFDEDSRVKVPALLHFTRLGYIYQSKKGVNSRRDSRNNIFIDIFKESIMTINKTDFINKKIQELIDDIAKLTDTDTEVDKGKLFFDRLTSYNGIKLIDLEVPQNNDFRVVSELTFKKDTSEFRPDITILINGIPLGFLEVKKPNNKNGLKKEYDRMKYRQNVDDFKHFFKQFQVLGFSNNMPYNDESRNKLQGSYYTTPNFNKTYYNNFREEKEINVNNYLKVKILDEILVDNRIEVIKEDEEFKTNLDTGTDTNKFITSLFSRERLIFIIRYGIVYVDSARDGLHKHILRYPQFFAMKELLYKIKNGMTRGIIWHTQGSGKTALSYFATNLLRDYYSKKGVITKFYFVVDRLDLLMQASDEFRYRGMALAEINSKDDFINNIKSPEIMGKVSGRTTYKGTMNVVNIQKFSEESQVNIHADEDIQRVYFLDEVHRGYKPKGTFLANLLGADPNGIYVGLTGTPLLKEERKSTNIFSEYIHKYYYNKSIADGYTLKIKKENIATHFKKKVKSLLKLKKESNIPSNKWNEVTSKKNIAEEFASYIQDDFTNFKNNEIINDQSLGFMIVASTSEQARIIKKWFDDNSHLNTALVLYDEEDNKKKQIEFRGKKDKKTGVLKSSIDGVIVFSMLLTGFDAPRLKRLYLLRTIREHTLLQTLSRVNRPYKRMKYGYIADFVDITEQYEETNKRYLEELQSDILEEDDSTEIEEILVDIPKIKKRMEAIEGKLIKNFLGHIHTDLEKFRKQIETLEEDVLRELKGDLEEYEECYNELRISHEDVEDTPIDRMKKAKSEVAKKINLIVIDRILDDENTDVSEIDFSELIVEFIKTGEMFLEFDSPDEILELVNNIQNQLYINVDKKDDEYIKINKRFKNTIRKLKSDAEMIDKVLLEFKSILKDIINLNNRNSSLASLYGDESYMRIHKKLKEGFLSSYNEVLIRKILNDIIGTIEDKFSNLGGVPNAGFIKTNLKKPVRNILKKYINEKVSKEMCVRIINMFLEDTFKNSANY